METVEFLITLKAMEQQNAELPRTLSKVFAKAVKLLLDVNRSARQQALGPRFCVAKAQTPPPAAQASPAGTSADGSSSSYTTAPEGNEPVQMETAGPQRELVEDLRHDVERQMTQGPMNVKINLGKGIDSSTPSTPSPRLPQEMIWTS